MQPSEHSLDTESEGEKLIFEEKLNYFLPLIKYYCLPEQIKTPPFIQTIIDQNFKF